MSDEKLSARIAALSPEQRELLLKKMGARPAANTATRIPTLTDRAELPLSFAQQQLWLLDQLNPDKAVYNIPTAYRLDGELDAELLQRALQQLVDRHELLRTTFVTVKDEPRQRIAAQLSLTLSREDLRALSAGDREAALAARMKEEASSPFDLSRGPLLRARLLQLEERAWVLLFTVHHIVSDQATAQILLQELSALYGALREKRPSPLPAQPLQYADFAVWQREQLKGPAHDKQVSFWKKQLAQVPPLELPTDKPRPQVQSQEGAQRHFALSKALSEGVRALSRKEGVTPYMTLLAGLKLLLHRYSGQSDFAVGTPVAGRGRPELETLVGYFVSTLALRTELSGDPSFRELLARVKETVLSSFSNQDVPFELVVEALQPERSLSRNPLFQVMFSYEDAGAQTLLLSGAKIRPLRVEATTEKFDLTLFVADDGEGFSASIGYSTDLFEPATIDRMGEHLLRLLEDAVARPTAPITELSLMSQAEEQRVLRAWNDTALAYPDLCIHQLVEQQARATPDATALIAGERRLTYRELDERANHLAAELRKLGVGPEVLTALCVQRGADMVLGMLAILKAGGAYVPVDPAYPADRVQFILEDSKAAVLVSHRALEGKLPPVDAKVVFTDWSDSARAAAGPKTAVRPSNLAYLIYTSGSTGRPKAVSIEHRHAVAFLAWAHRAFGPKKLSSVLAATSMCFDLSVYEIFGTLSAGGRLYVAENALALPSLPAAGEVELVNTVPSAIAELAGSLPKSVKTINLAGEPLKDALVQKLYALGHVEEVFDLYGPSETTTYSTFTLRKRGPSSVATIGRPIGNTQVYLLDSKLRPVPVGVPGEVYIAGASVTRGYLGRPDITAERYLPNPFSDAPGARMYRTGDLARYYADGNLEYLGRIDHQVKVRGFRIELGEIEAALTKVPGVKESLVIALEDGVGDKQLVAYVAHGGDAVSADGLRAALSKSLPSYMVPQAYVLLRALPLTPNGKLDRRALPKPDFAAHRKAYVAPSNDVERTLAGIFARVLALDAVGVNDNFFEVGGDSRKVVRASLAAREAGLAVTPQLIFANPTVAQLAKGIAGATSSEERVPSLKDRSSAPLSFAQQQLWILDQLNPGQAVYNIPTAYRLDGELDPALLERALNQLIERHEALRTTFATVNGEARQVLHPKISVRIPLVDLRPMAAELREEEARQLTAYEAARPFDLAQGPLIRAQLLKLDDRSQLLLLTVHHIICDEDSTRVLMRELAELYGALREGRAPKLPPLPVQYADWSAYQREWLKGPHLDRQLEYWKKRLSGVVPIELATDFVRPPVQSQRGAQRHFTLAPALCETVRALSRKQGVTPYMTLLAAFKALLYRYSGQADITVGTPVAGRGARAELEQLIGFFVGPLVLRTDVNGQGSFMELLGRVRETVLGGFANQDVPFEKLVEALQPERSLSRNPLFQVMFSYVDGTAQALELSGVAVTPVRPQLTSEKFDLTLFLVEEKERFTFSLGYSTDLFDAATIDRMGEHFSRLLEDAMKRPDAPVRRLELLRENERRQILVDWNSTSAEFPKEQCLHQLFEAQVDRTPDAAAVEFEGQTLTYAQLDRRANALAARLREAGVGPGRTVALCVERSFEMVIGLYAVLKAGGGYVPLDPDLPADRIEFMLKDCGAGVLLCQRKVASKVPAFSGPVLWLDEDARAESAERPKPLAGPMSLAYGIYTSGSTGKPKLALNAHRGIVNRLWWMQDAYRLDATDVVLQKTPYAFDVSVWEFFWPLFTGAKLTVAKPGGHKDPAYLRKLIVESGITTLHFVPSMLQVFLEEGWPQKSAVKRVICSGEALPYELQQRFFAASSASLYNLYGPTEAAVDVTHWTCQREPQRKVVPIGRPISNLRMYVLDEELAPVPPGVRGELFIGGVGVGLGYSGRPELTAEKFIPDPFSSDPNARLYRTGDVGRQWTDGTIEYTGRADFQVKIRGFRIELGEIESLLLAQPSVRDVVVMAREDVPGDKRLVAYLAPKEGQTLSVDALKAPLQKALPEYMVPAAFVVLPELPLNANGKVDRKALPKPNWGANRKVYVAPSTETEGALARIWAQLLRLEKVGTNDNFFELGGDSLKVIRVASMAREAGLVVAPPMVFANPTIAQLAKVVDAAKGSGEELQHVQGGIAPRVGDVPVAYQEERFFRIWSATRRDGGLGKPCGPDGHLITGALDLPALEKALNGVLKRHLVLWSRFHEVDGQVKKRIEEPVDLPLRVKDLRHLPEDKRMDEAMADLAANQHAADDITAPAPRFFATVYRLADDRSMLAAVSSLGVFDAGSFGVLWRELFDLYARYSKGEPVAIASAPVQYADYAKWQRDWHTGQKVQHWSTFWRDKLKGAKAVSLAIPEDHAREPIDVRRGANFWAPFAQSTVWTSIDAELTKKLRAFTAESKTSLAVVTWSAFAAALGRRAKLDDVTMRTTNDTRRRVGGLDGVMGFFQNFSYWRLSLSGDPSFRQLCARGQTEVFSQLSWPEFQLVPFVYPEVDDLFRVMFNYVGAQLESGQRVEGLSLEPMPLDRYGKLFREPTHWQDWVGTVYENEDGTLAFKLMSNAAIWSEATTRSIAKDVVAILAQGVQSPDAPLPPLAG